jgi:hypothetical protein
MSTPAHSFDLHLAHSHAALQQLPEPKQVFKHLLMWSDKGKERGGEGGEGRHTEREKGGRGRGI